MESSVHSNEIIGKMTTKLKFQSEIERYHKLVWSHGLIITSPYLFTSRELLNFCQVIRWEIWLDFFTHHFDVISDQYSPENEGKWNKIHKSKQGTILLSTVRKISCSKMQSYWIVIIWFCIFFRYFSDHTVGWNSDCGKYYNMPQNHLFCEN